MKSRWRSHESGVKPGPLAPDSPIQAISLLLVVEEHTAFGGLGSAIAEILAEAALNIKFARIHLPEFIDFIGSQKELRHMLGLDASSIATRAMTLLTENAR